MILDSALSVTQLNTYVKMMFESDSRLQKICVVGEVSNFVNHYKTGHCYFSLKDSGSSVKAVMFAANAKRLKFAPENGMRVFITGRVSVFERDGVYQIYADSMEPEGAGAMMLAFEQLKNRLAGQGLFDESRKRALPPYPQKVAVVTSAVGAAVQDVLNILSRRYPLCEAVLCPVAAQGANCASDNKKAIERLGKRDDIDLIILCRGGGSAEDLWGYNDEGLVRAVAASAIPVVTGIGHETDFTLCDFAADLRAPTPSAAAELAVPDIEELYQICDSAAFRLENAVYSYLDRQSAICENIESKLKILDPTVVVAKRLSDYKNLSARLKNAVSTYAVSAENRLTGIKDKLQLLNPEEILKKGYAAAYRENKPVRGVSELHRGEEILLHFKDGSATCQVKNITLSERAK